MNYKLGMDIGGTKVNFGIFDGEKKAVAKKAVKLPPQDERGDLVGFLVTQLQLFLSEQGIGADEILSIGAGVPGTVSADGKSVLKAPNLGWRDFPLAAELQKALSLPVTLVQDSRAAAWGEYIAGAGKGKQCVICVTIGTGIGTGIVLNGNIYHGALGCAGELGHIPVKKNGRPCGCGRIGCLEAYAAGKGLGITATELFAKAGETLSAEELFRLAAEGNEKAQNALDEAIVLLGNAFVSAINLLSPDAFLISGGLSNRKEQFGDKLIAYIKEHIYTADDGKVPDITYAALGEDAPMSGAAFVPQNTKSMLTSASLMCADLLHLERDLRLLEEAKTDYLHFDIMDGHFVPNIMLPLEMIGRLRGKTTMPFDIHLMTENPEEILKKFKIYPGDLVSIQYESTHHAQRALQIVKDAGGEAVLAINPATPIEVCRDVLDDVSMILIMSVNPGYAGQKLIPQSLDKIKRMRKFLDELGYGQIRIEVDGNCSFENVVKMRRAGADTFVLGSSSVFDPNYGILKGMEHLRNCCEGLI